MGIEGEFALLRSELRAIERVHNPRDLNLHFEAPDRVDPQLFARLLVLARQSGPRRTVRFSGLLCRPLSGALG